MGDCRQRAGNGDSNLTVFATFIGTLLRNGTTHGNVIKNNTFVPAGDLAVFGYSGWQ